MKVIDNHFEGKPTLFINGLIINGCQTFTLEEADEVFKEFEVPLKMQQDVNSNYVPEGYEYTQEELNVLARHVDVTVRSELAKQGYGLDILVHDEDWKVRVAVAKQGYGLDILVHDENWYVRSIIARQGYGLDILVNDEACDVRLEVARQGYGLDILVNDEYAMVRRIAERKLKFLKK